MLFHMYIHWEKTRRKYIWFSMVGISVIFKFFLNFISQWKITYYIYNKNKTISLINVVQIDMLSFAIENIEVEELL